MDESRAPGRVAGGFHRAFAAARATALMLAAVACAGEAAVAQPTLDRVHGSRWLRVETPAFTVFSQQSARRAERFAREMTAWRGVSAQLIGAVTPLPAPPVPNLIYVFDDARALALFSRGEELGQFAATPRANYMMVAAGDSSALAAARHHYVHFLVRNFMDLRLPRWYEEGLAGSAARVQVAGERPELPAMSRRSADIMAQVSGEMPVERLLFRESALASPRLIQIANLKSEALLHYLRHSWEEEGFPDYRPLLRSYLDLLVGNRSPRFAFDRAFAVTPAQLESAFLRYLADSALAPARLDVAVPPVPEVDSDRVRGAELAVALGELALNFGRMENAATLFRRAGDENPPLPRALSGLGDALRLLAREAADSGSEPPASDQEIAKLFADALAAGPEELDILLDYGEYWEAELRDCERSYPAPQRARILADMERVFSQAEEQAPLSPEVNLALAQLELFPERDWPAGVAYQQRAFAALPADSFVMEQAVRYAIAGGEFDEAERLIGELAQPLHYWGEFQWVTDLRERLLRARRGEPYDPCGDGSDYEVAAAPADADRRRRI